MKTVGQEKYMLVRKIRLVGKLSLDEIQKFLRVYKSTMEDLRELFSADEEIRELLGD